MESLREIIRKHFSRKEEDLAPHAGMYYVVPVRGKSMVLSELADRPEDSSDHPVLWSKLVRWVLAPAYKLSPADVRELDRHPYGVPRGRVVRPEWHSMPEHEGQWVVYHGGFGPRETPENLRDAILREFNLNRLPVGQVAFVADPHERMDLQDRSVIQGLLRDRGA